MCDKPKRIKREGEIDFSLCVYCGSKEIMEGIPMCQLCHDTTYQDILINIPLDNRNGTISFQEKILVEEETERVDIAQGIFVIRGVKTGNIHETVIDYWNNSKEELIKSSESLGLTRISNWLISGGCEEEEEDWE